MSFEADKAESIKSLGDGDYDYKDVPGVRYIDGGGPHWSTMYSRREEYSTLITKKFCSRTIHGSTVRATYEKLGDKIVATAITDVDQTCAGPDGKGHMGLPARGAISVRRYYTWTKFGWQYSPKVMQEFLEAEQKTKDAEDAVILKRSKEDQAKRQALREARKANRNASN